MRATEQTWRLKTHAKRLSRVEDEQVSQRRESRRTDVFIAAALIARTLIEFVQGGGISIP
jgi:hypothetical protein